MHIRSILAITAFAFGLSTNMVNAQSRDARDSDESTQRHEQKRPEPSQSQVKSSNTPPHSAQQRPSQQSTRDKHHAASKPAPQRGHDRGQGAGPDRRFFKGDRLPAEQRIRQYVIDDWRDHHLSAPPRGQQWVQLGADYVLVAIATGIITQIVFGN